MTLRMMRTISRTRTEDLYDLQKGRQRPTLLLSEENDEEYESM